MARGESNLEQTTQLMCFSQHGNLCGTPSIVFPVGQTEDGGLPIAMMLTGRWWREHTLLRLAHAAETLRGEENGLPTRRAPAHLDDTLERALAEAAPGPEPVLDMSVDVVAASGAGGGGLGEALLGSE